MFIDFELFHDFLLLKFQDHRFLVKQTKLLYESNLNSDVPFSLNFAGLTKDSPLYQSFSERFINFEDIIVSINNKTIFCIVYKLRVKTLGIVISGN